MEQERAGSGGRKGQFSHELHESARMGNPESGGEFEQKAAKITKGEPEGIFLTGGQEAEKNIADTSTDSDCVGALTSAKSKGLLIL